MLMFSPGIGGDESRSMRLTGVFVDPLGTEVSFKPVGGERWAAEVLSPAEVTPWAEVWEDDAEEPAFVWAAEPELPPALSGLFLLCGLSCTK